MKDNSKAFALALSACDSDGTSHNRIPFRATRCFLELLFPEEARIPRDIMRSSSSSLLFRRRGQGKRGESSDEKASTMTSTSAPKQHRDPSTSTSLASSLVQVEPLHALSSAALHTTSLRSAAQALRAGPPLVPERDNTPLEELFAVVTMASLFGFVFLGPWLTLAALVDVLSRFSSSSPSPPSSSPSPTFYFSLAFLSCVAALTFLPVYPSGSWSYFRDARVWDCWRRYFKMKVVSPPLPFLEGVDEEEEEKEREEKSSGADSPRVTREGKAKAYIFAHYPHGCFPVGSFLSAVGLLGCPGTVSFETWGKKKKTFDLFLFFETAREAVVEWSEGGKKNSRTFFPLSFFRFPKTSFKQGLPAGTR